MDKQRDVRWVQRLEHYRRALDRLSKAASIVSLSQHTDGEVDDLLKEGLVQRFEYTQELAWKLMKDYAEFQGYTDIQGSRDALRTALEMGIIDDRAWMDTISARNLTSHCYDETEFMAVFSKITNIFLPLFLRFGETMEGYKNK